VSCTCEICATKPSHSLRLSPTTIGKSIFASPDATIHEGITSNRRGKAHDIFAIEERGDAHLQSLSPRMQTTGAGPASRRRRSRWGATIRARRSSRDCRRRESRGGADAPGRRRRGSRGGADEDGPRWCAGARLLPRRACGFFPGESSNFFPTGAATSSSSGPEIDPPAAASAPNRRVMSAAELMWRERGGGASGVRGGAQGRNDLGERGRRRMGGSRGRRRGRRWRRRKARRLHRAFSLSPVGGGTFCLLSCALWRRCKHRFASQICNTLLDLA
jgi:hypothetical protein